MASYVNFGLTKLFGRFRVTNKFLLVNKKGIFHDFGILDLRTTEPIRSNWITGFFRLPSDYADRYAFIASVVLFMILLNTKDKRKSRSHKGRGLARCRRRKKSMR